MFFEEKLLALLDAIGLVISFFDRKIIAFLQKNISLSKDGMVLVTKVFILINRVQIALLFLVTSVGGIEAVLGVIIFFFPIFLIAEYFSKKLLDIFCADKPVASQNIEEIISKRTPYRIGIGYLSASLLLALNYITFIENSHPNVPAPYFVILVGLFEPFFFAFTAPLFIEYLIFIDHKKKT